MEYVGIYRRTTNNTRGKGGGQGRRMAKTHTHTYTHANIKRSFSTISLCSRQMSKYQHQHTFQIVEKGPCTPLTIILKTSKLNANGRGREKEWLKKDEKHVFYQKTFDTFMYFISFRFILFFALNEITEWSVWQKRWITKATNGAAAIKKSIHLAHTVTQTQRYTVDIMKYISQHISYVKFVSENWVLFARFICVCDVVRSWLFLRISFSLIVCAF